MEYIIDFILDPPSPYIYFFQLVIDNMVNVCNRLCLIPEISTGGLSRYIPTFMFCLDIPQCAALCTLKPLR